MHKEIVFTSDHRVWHLWSFTKGTDHKYYARCGLSMSDEFQAGYRRLVKSNALGQYLICETCTKNTETY